MVGLLRVRDDSVNRCERRCLNRKQPAISKPDPLDLLQRDVVGCPVVKFRGPRGLMGGDVSCGFQCSAVLQIDRDPGRPEAVIANVSQQPGVFRPALHDPERIDPR